MQYLLDTNIVIYYFNGLTDDERIDALLIHSFNISIITQMEFLGWSGFLTDENLYQKAQEFISHANVFDLAQGVVDKTITLRQQHKIKCLMRLLLLRHWYMVLESPPTTLMTSSV